MIEIGALNNVYAVECLIPWQQSNSSCCVRRHYLVIFGEETPSIIIQCSYGNHIEFALQSSNALQSLDDQFSRIG